MDAFHKCAKSRDGVQSWCKECKRTYQAKGKAKALDLRVKEATNQVLRELGITDRTEFVAWRCANGGGKRGYVLPFYTRVKQISSTHWNRLGAPEACVRSAYEHILTGYKI
jgi:hypothetical protein